MTNVATASPILIKRYAGRRLYDTVRAAYLTLDDLADMLLRGTRFVVREAETDRDITREILTQLH
jgi:polyhydroxyalkanoate synthesis repressor PhaR